MWCAALLFQMSDQPTYESVSIQFKAFLNANSHLAAEKAFANLLNNVKFVDFTAHLLRCLQTAIVKTRFGEINVQTFFNRVLRILRSLLPLNMTVEFMGEKPPAKSEQAKRMRMFTLRHTLTDTWARLLEKELPDTLLLEALITLGDDQIEKMTDTARLLAPHITTVFDPPSNAATVAAPLASWSRAVSRTLLKIMHLGGLNFDRLYPRLYALLGEDLLTCQYADRFLEDLDVYLSSIHVPAGWLSAFAKRLAQLSLVGVAPLSLMLPLLTVIANCLTRHSACRVLIGRHANQSISTTETEVAIGDSYTYRPNDLAGDGVEALKSSLWEVVCLECHYNPEVASLAHRIRQIGTIATGIAHHLPDVKNQVSYGKELQAEVDRKARQYLTVLEMTNARLPSLPPLEGWKMPSDLSEASA
ncbi:unnamed protein product [Hydatigera taeniaeformis]|uniref:CBF domain-containing protein n=1 Tax=Hydatigena taeniaeformis TaxID=6205 RepID=A0A0R3X342_HYDTA|nr:unnamed protein product [Hydatigera taeniaeformis]